MIADTLDRHDAEQIYLVGDEAEETDIVAQRDAVVLSGRAVEFPANTGRAGVTLDVWEVDAESGQRVDDDPHATFEVGPDGEWGPVEVATAVPYEWVLSTDDTEVQHHLYLQPYLRSSHLVRLLSSEPDGDTRTNTNVGSDHSALVVMRMREWYATGRGDTDGARPDVLEVVVRHGDTETDAVDVISEFVGNGTIGLHLHDGADAVEESTLEPLPWFSEQPFQSGIDVFLPASADGAGTISVTNLPRGDAERPQVINVANWPSDTHTISVVFADFAVD
ncbi:MAG: hypothetical protein JJU45_01365 [Acidimicrobiia bacterium]|nr:hypothetical protein [Acidimicrobiia bacterium]